MKTIATRPLIQQAIEITEAEIRDPITHWGMNWMVARSLGVDAISTERFEDETRANAERRLSVLRGLLQNDATSRYLIRNDRLTTVPL